MSAFKVNSILDDLIGHVKSIGHPTRFIIDNNKGTVTAFINRKPIDYDISGLEQKYKDKMPLFLKQAFRDSSLSLRE